MPPENSVSVLVAAGKLFTPAVDNVIEKLGESASLLDLLGVLKKSALRGVLFTTFAHKFWAPVNHATPKGGCFSPPLHLDSEVVSRLRRRWSDRNRLYDALMWLNFLFVK